MNASILGLTRRETERIFDDIVDFAELERFIDMQVRHYSSGMYVRLGFAVAVNVEPDILLVDDITETAGTLTAQGARISLGATHDSVRSTTEKTRSEGGLTVSGGIDRLGLFEVVAAADLRENALEAFRQRYGGRTYTAPFEIWRDITLPSTDAELVASTRLQNEIIAAMNDVTDKINRIEIMRMKVEDLRKAHAADKALDADLAAIYKRMYETELHYLSRTEMHTDDKWYVEKYKIYFNLVWLLSEVGGAGGDVMGGNGYGPTAAAVEVFGDRKREIATAKIAFDKLMADVDAFNKAHAGKIATITDRM